MRPGVFQVPSGGKRAGAGARNSSTASLLPSTAAAAGGKNHKTTKRLPLHNPRVVYSITNYGNSLRLQLAGRLYRPRRTVKTRIYAAFECHPEDGAPLITQREQNRQKRGMGRGGARACSAV